MKKFEIQYEYKGVLFATHLFANSRQDLEIELKSLPYMITSRIEKITIFGEVVEEIQHEFKDEFKKTFNPIESLWEFYRSQKLN